MTGIRHRYLYTFEITILELELIDLSVGLSILSLKLCVSMLEHIKAVQYVRIGVLAHIDLGLEDTYLLLEVYLHICRGRRRSPITLFHVLQTNDGLVVCTFPLLLYVVLLLSIHFLVYFFLVVLRN